MSILNYFKPKDGVPNPKGPLSLSIPEPPTFHLPFPYCSANNLRIFCAFSVSSTSIV